MCDLDIPVVHVECCRECNFQYDFLLPNGEIVTVLCGQPHDVTYKAVSYLWENTKPLKLVCKNKKCSAVKTVPMRDTKKLRSILEFVRGGNKIWLDALSIDQDMPSDLTTQLMVMGDIYRDAKVVSVMLPREDEEAYEMLKNLAITADQILRRKEEFGMVIPALSRAGLETVVAVPQQNPQNLAIEYERSMSVWEESISKWNYWSRAWTFQEWTMAAEIEITWEGIPNHGGLQNIKNVIVSASTIIGHWKKQQAARGSSRADSLLAQVAVRAELSKLLNTVRMHFPFQDFLIADEIVDPIELRTRTSLTPMHSVSGGTSVEIFEGDPRTTPNLRQLLGLALTAISVTRRQARYEADLICCWASMCNIEYGYNNNDTYSLALQKIISALRKAGIRIFNFHANCLGGETDLMFMEYAAAMKQRNLDSEAYMSGAPIFTGRADTITHIKHCLDQPTKPAVLPRSCNVDLRCISNTNIQAPIPCKERVLAVSTFNDLVSGITGGVEVRDAVNGLQKLLDSLSNEQLEKYSLLPVSISCQDSSSTWDINAWAIIPTDINTSNAFIARESLNGTLVLAGNANEDEAQILAYLNMTHQRHGTYLIRANDSGIADIVFRKSDLALIDTLLTTDFSEGPKPVDPDLMAMLGVPSFGLTDALDEARCVQLASGTRTYCAA